MREVQAVSRTLGLQVDVMEIRHARDIDAAFDALKDGIDALYVTADPLIIANRIRINTFALAARLATMHASREYVEAAGLMAYGTNFPALFRHARGLRR
jgi:putative ABC transport system substrate-binding protein